MPRAMSPLDDRMKSPLLKKEEEPSGHAAGGAIDEELEEEAADEDLEAGALAPFGCGPCWRLPARAVWWHTVTLAVPLVLAYASTNAMSTTDMAMVGHLGDEKLAAITLSTAVIYAAFSFATGFNNALITLCGGAYGAGKFLSAGVWLQVGVVWTTLLFIPPVALVFAFTGEILSSLGACTPEVCADAGEFARWSLLWLWPSAMFAVMCNWLEAIEIVNPQAVVSMVFVGINVALNYVLIYGVGSWGGMGFLGSPIATSITRILQLAALWVWVVPYKRLHEETWGGWSRKCLRWSRLKTFLRIGTPEMLTDGLAEWVFEVVTVYAGSLGHASVSAVGLMSNLVLLFVPLVQGVFSAANIRVAHLLGAGRPQRARLSAITALQVGTLVAALIGVLFMALREYLPYVYSHDEATVELARDMGFVVAGYAFLSSVDIVMHGILEGQMRPIIPTAASVVGNWAVGLPASFLLSIVAHLHTPVIGLWWGILIGECVHFLILAFFLLRSDWQGLSDKAVALHDEDEEDYDDEDGEDDDQLRPDYEESVGSESSKRRHNANSAGSDAASEDNSRAPRQYGAINS